MEPDYATLIDAETWAFIAQTARYYPADAITQSVAEQRAVYDRMCRAFWRGYPAGVTARDADLAGVPVRRYVAGAGRGPARLVYLHGGGFVVGGLDSHDDICAEFCAGTGFEVISADYCLSPDHFHPAAYNDALAVTRAVLAEGGPVLVGGDSAGATLAASVALTLGRALHGHVLIYAGLGADMTAGSYVTHAAAPMLTTQESLFYSQIRAAPGQQLAREATAQPLAALDYSGLSPVFAVSAECDPCCDDAAIWVDRVRAAGGRGVWVKEPGLVHGYLRARATSRRAAASFERIIAAMSRLGHGAAP